MKISRFAWLASATALAFTMNAQVLTVPFVAPVGVAANTSHVFVSNPYFGGGANTFQIFDLISGSPVLYATLPSKPPGTDLEVYLALSSGLGGFPAGDLFATFGDQILQIHNGTVLSPAFASVGAPGSNHAGITFDTVGTFGYNMIVTGDDGKVFVIDHTGTIVNTLTPVLGPDTLGGDPVVQLEAPHVAPLTFGKYGGYLWLMGESSQKIYVVSPLDGSTTTLPTPFAPSSGGVFGGSPESIQFMNGVCSVTIPNGQSTVSASYVDAVYGGGSGAGGSVYFYDVTGVPKSMALLSNEFSGTIDQIDGNGSLGSSFALGLPQQEGSSTVGCSPTLGCVLTQGGYKNHFNSKVLNFPPLGLTLGTVLYSNTQLNQILQNNAVGGNGLVSLAHQLITAELNIYYGAYATPQVATAVVQANALIGGLVVPPVGNGKLSTSSESAIETILNNFNNGLYGPTECK